MKDRFDIELRSIMDEESEKIFMSDELKESILRNSRYSYLDRIRAFLNSYIEIPIPVALGVFIGVIMINLIPAFNIDIDLNDKRVIEIGNSQVVVRELKDVKDYED